MIICSHYDSVRLCVRVCLLVFGDDLVLSLAVYCCLDMKVDFDFMPYLASIYQCTLLKLRATDIDQEVKERAITCM